MYIVIVVLGSIRLNVVNSAAGYIFIDLPAFGLQSTAALGDRFSLILSSTRTVMPMLDESKSVDAPKDSSWTKRSFLVATDQRP